MALKCLQTLAAVSIPDLDRIIARRWRKLCRAVLESDQADPTAMTLERLQAVIPFISYIRLDRDPIRLFLFKKTPYQAAGWTK